MIVLVEVAEVESGSLLLLLMFTQGQGLHGEGQRGEDRVEG